MVGVIEKKIQKVKVKNLKTRALTNKETAVQTLTIRPQTLKLQF